MLLDVQVVRIGVKVKTRSSRKQVQMIRKNEVKMSGDDSHFCIQSEHF